MTIELNRENLKLVLDHIKADPDTWDQTNWHSECGTKHCFAGWAQILSGKPLSLGTVRRDARIFLGLAKPEADYLFAGSRTLEDFEMVLTKGLYAHAGYNHDGYDHAGYDRVGFNRDGYDRDGYDREGYDYAGYDRDGLDANNNPPASAAGAA